MATIKLFSDIFKNNNDWFFTLDLDNKMDSEGVEQLDDLKLPLLSIENHFIILFMFLW